MWLSRTKPAHLVAKAHEFCAKIAEGFPDPQQQVISIPGIFKGALAAEQPPDGTTLFLIDIPWHECFYPGAKMLFPAKPPIGDVKFSLPADSVEGRGVQIKVKVPADTLTLTGLQIVSGAKPASEASSSNAKKKKGKEKGPQAPQVSAKPKQSRALQQLAEFFDSGSKWLPASSKRRP